MSFCAFIKNHEVQGGITIKGFRLCCGSYGFLCFPKHNGITAVVLFKQFIHSDGCKEIIRCRPKKFLSVKCNA